MHYTCISIYPRLHINNNLQWGRYIDHESNTKLIRSKCTKRFLTIVNYIKIADPPDIGRADDEWNFFIDLTPIYWHYLFLKFVSIFFKFAKSLNIRYMLFGIFFTVWFYFWNLQYKQKIPWFKCNRKIMFHLRIYLVFSCTSREFLGIFLAPK